MILTDDEMRQVRQCLEEQAGLDPELMLRCGDLLRLGKFDEAVRSAFVLLEERLRKAIPKEGEGMTGTQLANTAFSPQKGPLAKALGRTQAEKEGLRELFSGAFKLFRNPTAHGAVGYDAVAGKAIVGLVNLLLRIMQWEPPPPFPEHVEQALSDAENAIGPGAASQLRMFLGRCTKAGIKPTIGRQWIPFKRHALVQYEQWDKPKPYRIPVFYLLTEKQALWFPANQYYTSVIGLDVEPIIDELKGLGFYPAGRHQDLRVDLRIHNDKAFFDNLYRLVMQIVRDFEATLQGD